MTSKPLPLPLAAATLLIAGCAAAGIGLSLLTGKPLDESTLAQAAQLAMDACDPTPDQRGDVEYKTAMAGEMTRRALLSAQSRARP